MSDKIDDGGAAFPTEPIEEPGISKADWFAGQALTAIIGNLKEIGVHSEYLPNMAKQCYKIADAMLNERERRNA